MKEGYMMKKRLPGQKKRGYGIYAAALIMAAGVFSVMTYLQREALSAYEKRPVYIAAEVIPRGTVIDEGNIDDYLVLREVDAGCVPETALGAGSEIEGLSPVFDIDPGTLISPGMFSDRGDVLRGMDHPVLAGFKTDDLSRAVSGVLRAGDRIDIYSCDPETEEGMLLCDDIYIERGYDSSGNVTYDTGASVMFNIYLESSQVRDFYEGLKSGSLYVVKRC